MVTTARTVVAGLCALTIAGSFAASASAQTAEVKEKPPMYTYEASWVMPRATWPDVEKNSTVNQKTLEHAMASGGLIGYGNDSTVIHTGEGATHDNWFSGMSAASVLNALDEIYKAGSSTSAVLTAATKHWDNLYVSRYYNWRAGSWKGAYTRWSAYTLKADAPSDAMEVLAKSFTVPLMEKLLADGAIVEYEIDVEAVHTASPAEFYVIVVTPTAEGLDKVNAALSDAVRKAPLVSPALDASVDFTKHRDGLVRSMVTYK